MRTGIYPLGLMNSVEDLPARFHTYPAPPRLLPADDAGLHEAFTPGLSGTDSIGPSSPRRYAPCSTNASRSPRHWVGISPFIFRSGRTVRTLRKATTHGPRSQNKTGSQPALCAWRASGLRGASCVRPVQKQSGIPPGVYTYGEASIAVPVAASPVAASPVAASPVAASPVAASPVAASPTPASVLAEPPVAASPVVPPADASVLAVPSVAAVARCRRRGRSRRRHYRCRRLLPLSTSPPSVAPAPGFFFCRPPHATRDVPSATSMRSVTSCFIQFLQTKQEFPDED